MRGTLQEELAKMSFALPVMPLLAEHLKREGSVEGKKIGWHCHLTEITAAAVLPLIEAGAQLFLCECNPETTNQDSVEYMRSLGAKVYSSCEDVLAARPLIISDTGLVLTRAYEASRGTEKYIFAGSEITTSGITAAQSLPSLSLPVFDINCGQIKTYIENYHGVADGVMDLLAQLTGRVWAGHDVAVVGYGIVGRGIAAYLRRAGAGVTVVEIDPVRNLIAHYDGYRLSGLDQAVASCSLLVTATGSENLIRKEQWNAARDGTLFVNVGHWASELDIDGLKSLASSNRQYAPFLNEYTLPSGKRIYVIAEGGPANVVTLSGSQEPTLIHLTTEILCMNYLLKLEASGTAPDARVQPLPAEVERTAAELALQALKLSN
jgi:adenosylhomocysteinase